MHGLWKERWAKHPRLANVAHFDRLLCITWLIITMRTEKKKNAEMKSCQPEGNECSINLLIIFWINWADFCFLEFVPALWYVLPTQQKKKKKFKIFRKLSSRPYDISGVNTLFGIFLNVYMYFSLVYRKIGLNFFVLVFVFYFLTSSFTKRCF